MCRVLLSAPLPHYGAAKPLWRPWSDADFGASTIKKAAKLCQRHYLCCWLLIGTIACFLKQWRPWRPAGVLQVCPWFHLKDLAGERHSINVRTGQGGIVDDSHNQFDLICRRFDTQSPMNKELMSTLRRYRILLITEPPARFIFFYYYYITLFYILQHTFRKWKYNCRHFCIIKTTLKINWFWFAIFKSLKKYLL